jgi:hypothetical protein
MQLKVECHGGHRGDEEPAIFYLERRAVTILEVLDRWPSPGHRYYKVRTDDGGTYILRHDELSGQWELTLFHAMSVPHALSRKTDTALNSH